MAYEITYKSKSGRNPNAGQFQSVQYDVDACVLLSEIFADGIVYISDNYNDFIVD